MTESDTDLIRKTAERAAAWWRDRYDGVNPDRFEELVKAFVCEQLSDTGQMWLYSDYDPQDELLSAVRGAGQECRGMMFSSDHILPTKTGTQITPGRIEPKEGYGNWTEVILVDRE